MNDIIADLIARINNGLMAKRFEIYVLKSKNSIRFLTLLEERGFIRGYKFQKEKPHYILVLLKYTKNKPVIKKLKKISTKGRRIYVPLSVLWRLNQGWGTLFISTTKGLITDEQARKFRVSGEVVAYVE